MQISQRDGLFIGAALIIVAVLVFGTSKKLGPDIPVNAVHKVFFRQLERGDKRLTLEKGCIVCHPALIRSKKHPPKEECMVCHQLPNSDS